MNQFSPQRLAQISIGILLLIIIRSLGEYFRLQYAHGDALTFPQVTPYVTGALVAAAALALAILCYFAGRHRETIVITIVTAVALPVYKVAVVR